LRVKGYGKRKNASHALNEEDEEFLWQSGQLAQARKWKEGDRSHFEMNGTHCTKRP